MFASNILNEYVGITLVANLREQRVSCSDSSLGDTLTNIKLQRQKEDGTMKDLDLKRPLSRVSCLPIEQTSQHTLKFNARSRRHLGLSMREPGMSTIEGPKPGEGVRKISGEGGQKGFPGGLKTFYNKYPGLPLAVSTERVLQKVGQLRISIRNVLFLKG